MYYISQTYAETYNSLHLKCCAESNYVGSKNYLKSKCDLRENMKISFRFHHTYSAMNAGAKRSEVKWSDVPLLDQRQVLTKANVDWLEAPRKNEDRVIKLILVFYFIMKLSFLTMCSSEEAEVRQF